MSKKMAIINLSKTKMDSKSKLIINGKCDEVMKMIMNGLNLEPEKYFGPRVVEKRPKRKIYTCLCCIFVIKTRLTALTDTAIFVCLFLFVYFLIVFLGI